MVESISADEVFERFWPWLYLMVGGGRYVNSFYREDWELLENGFPRVPYSETQLATYLHTLRKSRIVRMKREVLMPGEVKTTNEDVKIGGARTRGMRASPSVEELVADLRNPQSGPVQYRPGRIAFYLTERGRTATFDRMFEATGLQRPATRQEMIHWLEEHFELFDPPK